MSDFNEGEGYSEADYGGGGAEAAARVQGPAIGLIVTAVLGMLSQVASILMNLLGIGMGASQGGDAAMANVLSGGVGIAFSILAIIMGVVVLLGALKMKKLESHGFALAAAIIAMIPCISPCCLLGLPMGIWALVVLLNQDVKQAFQQ